MSDEKTLDNINSDEWNNIHSGVGYPNRDKKASTRFSSHIYLGEKELTLMYKGDGITSRIVDSPSDSSVSKWFKVTNDIGNVISKYLFEKNYKVHLSKCLKWSRLYGGGIIVLVINDDGELFDPVNEDNIIEIEGCHIYTRYEVTISMSDYYQDPKDPKFGTPQYYNITPNVIMNSKDSFFKVHESRILRIDGHELPERYKTEQQGWGQSEVERIFTQIKNSGTIDSAIPDIIREKNIRILKIKNYMNMIARNDKKTIQERLNMMDLSMDQSNTLMIDQEEDIQIISQNISGLSDIIDRYNDKLCAVSRIPSSILFRTNRGLGSGGDDKLDLEMWQEHITDIQDKKLRPQLNKLIKYTMISKNGPTAGKIIDGWSIEFLPIKTISQKEELETRKLQSDIDEKMMDTGVYSNKTVAKSRYGEGGYSYDTIIDENTKEIDNSRNNEE